MTIADNKTKTRLKNKKSIRLLTYKETALSR